MLSIALDVELKDFFDFDGRPSVEEMRSKVMHAAQDADYLMLEKMAAAVTDERHACKQIDT